MQISIEVPSDKDRQGGLKLNITENVAYDGVGDVGSMIVTITIGDTIDLIDVYDGATANMNGV